jgi:hypothetical protein
MKKRKLNSIEIKSDPGRIKFSSVRTKCIKEIRFQ